MARGRVTEKTRCLDGNPKGVANANPILDTREYIVTFDDGDATELTATLIAESKYAQCDPDGNQYVLLDSIIDYRHLIRQQNYQTSLLSTIADGLLNDVTPLAGSYAANGM